MRSRRARTVPCAVLVSFHPPQRPPGRSRAPRHNVRRSAPPPLPPAGLARDQRRGIGGAAGPRRKRVQLPPSRRLRPPTNSSQRHGATCGCRRPWPAAGGTAWAAGARGGQATGRAAARPTAGAASRARRRQSRRPAGSSWRRHGSCGAFGFRGARWPGSRGSEGRG